MTALIIVVAVLVAAAAAARSTWSPCGLSMLSTITPVTERAKGNYYRTTASWFVVGAVVGGASLGAVMATLAVGVRSFHLSSGVLGLLALAAALVAGVSDSGAAGVRVPIHRRQVNERWLDQYRPWVYGAGFGWQIGTGVTTYITTAAVYLMVVLGALTTSPLVALVIGCGFGLCRGLAVFLTMRITNPTALRAFHRRFTEVGPIVGRVATATEFVVAAALGVAVVGMLGPWPALAIVGLALAASAVGHALTGRRLPEPTSMGAGAGPVPAGPEVGSVDSPMAGPVAAPVSSVSA
jgi:MFS family permease